MPSHEGASPPASSVTGRCHFQAFTHVGTKEIARQHVLQFSKPLAAVLAEGSFQGVLVVYVASSSVWKKTVDLVSSSGEGLRASDLTAQALADRAASLMRLNAELVETKQHCNETMRMLEAAAPSLSDLNRVRIVTPLDFIDVLDYINSRLPDNFKYWFQQTTYDAPKIIDHILRLRNIGFSCPVMRFDCDVLFNDRTLADNMALVADSIRASVTQHQLCISDFVAQTWWFSGQYGGITKAEELGRFQSWSEAFSTRANPALLATPALCDAAQFTGHNNWLPHDDELDAATFAPIMFRFYGVQGLDEPNQPESQPEPELPDDTKISVDDGVLSTVIPTGNAERDLLSMGNTYFGANPLRACVSGSAFCVSDSLTLDLPPFSNFRLNVMWIDDHHLGTLAQQVKAPPLRYRSNHDMCAIHYAAGKPVKARGKPGNVAWYTLECYLPTLLYGIIMDGWLLCNADGTTVANYADKFLPSDLAECPSILARIRALQADRDQAHDGSDHHGIFSRSILETMRRGRPLDKDKLELLRRSLCSMALQRCQEVYWQWRHLPTGELDGQQYTCFASLWATGEVTVHPQLADFCAGGASASTCTRSLRLGCGLVRAEYHLRANAAERYADLPPLEIGDLNPHIAHAIETELLEDALSYLDWILVWPTVVQAVRSVNDGRLSSDISYEDLHTHVDD